MNLEQHTQKTELSSESDDLHSEKSAETKFITEIGGFTGPEPTRYGDWEKNGRCIDF
jgi:hypothetical protein